MADLPLLCAALVVRAILGGRQTQDRRPVKNPDGWLLANPSAGRIGCYQKTPPHFYAERDLEHPFTPGDVLYVRETWAKDAGGGIIYAAENYGMTPHPGPWKPSIHMRKEHARIHLRVLSVRVERVNAISEADAMAEGCDSVAAFAALWDRLYGAGSFDRGDWCWVTTFERVEVPRG